MKTKNLSYNVERDRDLEEMLELVWPKVRLGIAISVFVGAILATIICNLTVFLNDVEMKAVMTMAPVVAAIILVREIAVYKGVDGWE